jgi:hypothetical protein
MPRIARNRLLLAFVATALSACLVPAAGAASKSAAKRVFTAPSGLTEVKVAGFHHSYVRKGADLTTPRAVCVSTGELTFAADWPRASYGRKMSAKDLKRIQEDFNKAVQREFEKAFRNQAGYSLASSDSGCALRITASVQDLYLNAPEVFTAARTKTYARSIGRLRMQVDVYDASGAVLLARAHGSRSDPEKMHGMRTSEILEESNRVTDMDNIAFAQDAARRFAEYTRTRLLNRS